MPTQRNNSGASRHPTIESRRIARLHDHFPELDLDALEVVLALGRASVAVDRALSDHIVAFGLTPVALQTLITVYLADDGPLNLTDIGAQLRVTKANVSLVLAGLERQKLIKREADPGDGRRLRARMTKRGQALVAEVLPRAVESVELALAPLPKRDRKQLKELSERISGALPYS